MPKGCVQRKMKTGMSKDAAMKVCYPDSRFARDRKQKAGPRVKKKKKTFMDRVDKWFYCPHDGEGC